MAEALEDKVSKKGLVVNAVSGGLKLLATTGGLLAGSYLTKKAQEMGVSSDGFIVGCGAFLTYLSSTGAIDVCLAGEKLKSLREGRRNFEYTRQDPGYISSSTKEIMHAVKWVFEPPKYVNGL